MCHEDRGKNHQQNISKFNPTMYKKRYMLLLSEIYLKYIGLGQHLKISVIHDINRLKKKKSHGYINRCRESILQNGTSIHNKNSQYILNRRKLPNLIFKIYKKGKTTDNIIHLHGKKTIPTKNRNKVKMSPLVNPFQNHAGSPS